MNMKSRNGPGPWCGQKGEGTAERITPVRVFELKTARKKCHSESRNLSFNIDSLSILDGVTNSNPVSDRDPINEFL